MMFFVSIFSFLKSYWKYWIIPMLMLSLYLWAYSRGKHDCQNDVAREAQKQIEKRHDNAAKESKKTSDKRKQYQENIKKRPINDKRDSCILSNDPFKKDCLKE